jgi:hypothetical protein
MSVPRNGNIRRVWNFVGTIHGIQLTRKTHHKPETHTTRLFFINVKTIPQLMY